MKRTLSVILALVMLFGVLPLTTVAGVGALGESDIAGTGAPGSSEDNPLYVSNFADLKAALESDNTLYIQVDSFEYTTGYGFYILEPNVDYKNFQAAITQKGTKYLKLLSDVDCRAVNIGTFLFCFINCIGKLNISGTGKLSVSFNSGSYSSSSIVYVQNPGELTVDGNVTLDASAKAVDAYGRAVDNHSGKVTLNSGKYFGWGQKDEGSRHTFAEAVHIYSGETVINDGEFQAVYGTENYGIYNASDNTVLNGGKFHGIKNGKYDKKLSEILGESCSYRDVDTGMNFDGSAVQSTEKTLEVYNKIATVTFSENGGTGVMESVKVEKGTYYTLPECTFTPPEGKVFSRWQVGLYDSCSPGESVTIYYDTPIWAVWKNDSSGGYSISGKVTSFLDNVNITTVTLSKKQDDDYLYSGRRTVPGGISSISGVDYRFNGLSNGQYKLTVSKKNHIDREYTVTVLLGSKTVDVKICPIGDVNGDGSVTNFDYSKVNQHVCKIKGKELTDYAFKCADVNEDGKVTNFDAGKINQHVCKVKSLFQ